MSPFGKGPVPAKPPSPVGQRGGTPRAEGGNGTPVACRNVGDGMAGNGRLFPHWAVGAQAQPKGASVSLGRGSGLDPPWESGRARLGFSPGFWVLCPPCASSHHSLHEQGPLCIPRAVLGFTQGRSAPIPPIPSILPIPPSRTPAPVRSCRGKFAEEHKHFLPCPHGHCRSCQGSACGRRGMELRLRARDNNSIKPWGQQDIPISPVIPGRSWVG